MVAYQFYWNDEAGKEHLIGVLPERRKDPERISNQLIMNWVRGILGESAHFEKIHFVKVNV